MGFRRPLGILIFAYAEIVVGIIGMFFYILSLPLFFMTFCISTLFSVLSFLIVFYWLNNLGRATRRFDYEARREHIFFSPLLGFIAFLSSGWLSSYFLIGNRGGHFFGSFVERIYDKGLIVLGFGITILTVYYFSRPRVRERFLLKEELLTSVRPLDSKVFAIISLLIALGTPFFMYYSFFMMFSVGTGGFPRFTWWQIIFVVCSWFFLIRSLRTKVYLFFTKKLTGKKFIFLAVVVIGVLGMLLSFTRWSYQRYLRSIFTSYISDTVPAGVHLIGGQVHSWLDLFVNLEFEVDKNTLKEITKNYNLVEDEVPELGIFPEVKGPAHYYYKEVKKTTDYYVGGEKKTHEYCITTYLVWQEQTRRANVRVTNSCYPHNLEAELRLEKRIRKIESYLEEGNLGGAFQDLNQLIADDPKGAGGRAYDERFCLYLITNEYEKALEDINVLLGMRKYYSPFKEMDYLCDRGDIYMAMDKYTEALNDYTSALKLNNELKDPQALKRYEVEWRNKYKLNEAEDDSEKFVFKAGDPWYSGSRREAPFLLNRAKAYRKLQRYDEAIQDLTRVIEESSSECNKDTKGESYFYRGLVYKEINEPEKAKKDFVQVQSLGDKLTEGSFIRVHGKCCYYGTYKWYYPDGTLKAQGSYHNSKYEGPYKWYHENGILRCSGNYKNNKEEGIFTWFDKAGKLIKELNYVAGKKEGR